MSSFTKLMKFGKDYKYIQTLVNVQIGLVELKDIYFFFLILFAFCNAIDTIIFK